MVYDIPIWCTNVPFKCSWTILYIAYNIFLFFRLFFQKQGKEIKKAQLCVLFILPKWYNLDSDVSPCLQVCKVIKVE